ncbi:MAG: ankyrin repeat domain-containing protein [Leptospiraceae bacterium]|nr:ankyrin repeat domain-containing protein [Leptospiraceae bacterium]
MKIILILLALFINLNAEEKLSAPPENSGNQKIVKFASRSLNKGIDTQNRADVVKFYKSDFLQPKSVKNGWTGSIATCTAGTNSKEFSDATLKTLNYFRAMVGVPADITFKDEFSSKALKSALIMEANFNLSHNPPTNWKCYSEDGKKGAGSSNIAVGASGPSAITLYIRDPGSGNYFVGHRRWIISPSQLIMGSGSTNKGDSLWVFGEWRKEKTTKEYISWPNSGYVPSEFGYAKDYRWSFTAFNADVKNANIIVKKDGKNLAIFKEKFAANYGEGSTIVWTVPELQSKELTKDEKFEVEIQNIQKEGKSISHNYSIIFINPNIESPNDSSSSDSNKDKDPKQLTPEETFEFAKSNAKGDIRTTIKFLEQGADPNMKYKGWTPLMLSAYYGHVENIKVLLKYNADKSIELQGFKPIDFANANNHKGVIELLSDGKGLRKFRTAPPVPPEEK